MLTSQPTHMTIVDYCNAMDRKEITINRNYQRSDKVWPDTAKSFLIESLLLGFPIPKIFLHSKTDLRTRKTTKEVVDGQQRSRTIYDFFHDRFALSNKLETEDIRGLRYSNLDEDWQARLVSYSLSIDLFLSADPEEVRQIFRRINSYTVPLNPEELRHADYQGEFKWFIYQLSHKYAAVFREVGIFSEKSLVRMQDMKLFTEICHAIENGVTTTNKAALNSLYKKYDQDEEGVQAFREPIERAFDKLAAFEFISGTPLARPFIIYSLALAVISAERDIPDIERQALIDLEDVDAVERRLGELSEALILEGADLNASPWKDFVEACSSKTNVKEQRGRRIEAFKRVLAA